MEIIMTPNMMRRELANRFKSLRNLRNAAIENGGLDMDGLVAYRRQIATAFGFAETLDEKIIAEPALKRIVQLSADQSLAKYDCSQDGWWTKTEAGKEFVSLLRLLSMHYLHSGVYSTEDSMHVFQIIKMRFEKGQEMREHEDFVRPAYGGLSLPKDYLGPLLVHLTDNKHLIPVGNGSGITLRLDWWPEDGNEGVKEMGIVLKAAQVLGYFKVEFLMPQAYPYEELRKQYNGTLQCRQEGSGKDAKWMGTVKVEQPLDYRRNALMENVEFGSDESGNEVRLWSFSKKELNGVQGTYLVEKGEYRYVAAVDSVGFADRLLLASEKQGGESSSGGLYLPEGHGLDVGAMAKEAMTRMQALLEHGIAGDEGWKKLLSELSDIAKPKYTYAVLKHNGDATESWIEAAQ